MRAKKVLSRLELKLAAAKAAKKDVDRLVDVHGLPTVKYVVAQLTAQDRIKKYIASQRKTARVELQQLEDRLTGKLRKSEARLGR